MENSKIEWTDHTFNPWWGCVKVSPGCKNCYAETLDNRYHKEKPHWGPNSERKLQSLNYWKQPAKWNKEAAKLGVKKKVFCASMADVFEDHPDVIEQRARLFYEIMNTPNLIWQLLTKRPENIMKMIPHLWRENGLPENVWIGCTTENQEQAELRIPHLIQVPAKVLFLSCEPMLGPINLPIDVADGSAMINWVICGGESGHAARPMNYDWVNSLRKQCKESGTSFFFKQWGEWVPELQLPKGEKHGNVYSDEFVRKTEDGNDYRGQYMYKIGKKYTGAQIDGIEYKEFPQ